MVYHSSLIGSLLTYYRDGIHLYTYCDLDLDGYEALLATKFHVLFLQDSNGLPSHVSQFVDVMCAFGVCI